MGPIVDGEPTRDGTKFDAWKAQLEADRYSVRHTTLNAADYGDATSRRRFFVMARRDYRPAFPDPTHSQNGDKPGTDEWRSAAEIIDWSDLGDSIWTRSRPLSNNTMQRIAEGIRQHCADSLAPYADAIAEITPEDVEAMQENVVALDDLEHTADERDDPFLVEGPAAGPDADETELSTTMVMGQHSNALAKDATESPVSTIATRGAIPCIHADPFVLPRNGAFRGLHSNSTYEPDERPLHTVTAKNHDGHLVWPFLVPYKSEREGQCPRTHEIEEPYPTITATGSDPYLARPFLVEYYGNSDVESLDEPLPTVTTKDRHALCIPDCYPWGLDLRYRMLQPRELAAAQGFPETYEFAGNKTQTTKQIGNAVPVCLGKALVKHLLLPTNQPTVTQYETPQTVADDGETADD
nr:DNA cytosine methyltransferase [Saliphagus infecundisoli]